MPKIDTYDLINIEDIRVSILQNSHFTIGTSPYYAHQHGLAIDIYHNLSLENYSVVSPVSGRVIKTKKLIAPRAKFKGGLDNDYIIIVQNSDNADVVYKILHIKPKVSVGDFLEIGDIIGNTIRNGYFAYWSSPHLHLEIRPQDDPLRARGGKDFSLATEISNIMDDLDGNHFLEEIPIEIHSVYPEFLLANLPTNYYYKIKPIYGVKGNVEDINCIIDGGIPHYKYGTAIFQDDSDVKTKSSVYLGHYQIGSISASRGKFGFIDFDPVSFLLNGKKLRGLSLFLANFMPLIKLIPYNKNSFSFKSSTTQYLTVNMDKKPL